jgi:pilus assembly protein CpaB
MRLSRQAALALAILLGCLAVILGYTYLRGDKPPVEEVVQKIALPVPIDDIPAHADLRRDMFHEVFFEHDQVPRGVITDPTRLQGRIALRELHRNEPVKSSAVAVRSGSLGLAYAVPLQSRAMTIPIDDISGVANLLHAGDRVDVLVLFNDDTGKMSTVQTVLQDIEILALNDIVLNGPDLEEEHPASANGNGNGNGGGTGKPAERRGEGPRTVTLSLTPHQAQILMLSQHRGTLRLSLRRTGDRDIIAIERSQSWSLIGSFPSAKPPEEQTIAQPEQRLQPGTWAEMWGGPPAPAPAAAPAPDAPVAREPAVEVIRGANREFITPVE